MIAASVESWQSQRTFTVNELSQSTNFHSQRTFTTEIAGADRRRVADRVKRIGCCSPGRGEADGSSSVVQRSVRIQRQLSLFNAFDGCVDAQYMRLFGDAEDSREQFEAVSVAGTRGQLGTHSVLPRPRMYLCLRGNRCHQFHPGGGFPRLAAVSVPKKDTKVLRRLIYLRDANHRIKRVHRSDRLHNYCVIRREARPRNAAALINCANRRQNKLSKMRIFSTFDCTSLLNMRH